MNYEFNHLFPKQDGKNLRESLLEGFKNLNLKIELDNVTSDSEKQNNLLTMYRRFVRKILFFDMKNNSSFNDFFTFGVIYAGVKAGLCNLLEENSEVIIPDASRYFFEEVIAALIYTRNGEKEVNKDSLSVKLLSIFNGKIITLINVNKFHSGILTDLSQVTIIYKGEKIEDDKKNDILNRIDSSNINDIIVKE